MKRARHEIDSPSSQSHVGVGDARLPKISRKVHACKECQTRKIKCDVGPERAICTRCSKKGLHCVVNKSLQSLLEEETEWKESMEGKSRALQAAVDKILSVLDLPPLESFVPRPITSKVQILSPEAVSDRLQGTSEPRIGRTAAMAMTRENSQEPELTKVDDALVSGPMSSLYEVTKLRNLRSNPSERPKPPGSIDDFISRGKVDEAEAEELFGIFNRSFNHYLWGGIALVHDNLMDARRSSTLLVAAILTVTVLHIPGRSETFDACYAEFISLICDSMFERYHVLDGVRGLCIGAFWLSDVSWKLSGHAVRIATELNLHQSYFKAIRGSQEHIEGTRLWYFLYVCDHHFSISYSRPPVIHEDASITHHEKFLELPCVSQADLRLHSQVAIFIILTKVYNAFGPNTEQKLSEDDLATLRHFNVDLDSWRMKWYPLLAPNPFVASYPAKGVILHQHFGKLQVSSLALRGIQTPGELTVDRRALAITAIECAMAILQIVLEDPDVKISVVGVPLYLHTMITYSTVFLLKVQQRWGPFKVGTDPIIIRDLVTRTIDLLNGAQAGERHLTSHMATGLTEMLSRFTAWEAHEEQTVARSGHAQLHDPGINAPQHIYEPPYGLNGEYGSYGLFDNVMQLYDEQYFPMGFFDVMASNFDTAQRN